MISVTKWLDYFNQYLAILTMKMCQSWFKIWPNIK